MSMSSQQKSIEEMCLFIPGENTRRQSPIVMKINVKQRTSVVHKCPTLLIGWGTHTGGGDWGGNHGQHIDTEYHQVQIPITTTIL